MLELTRAQILGHRRDVGALDARLPPGADSIRRAAWAGLQDSMPRAAVLSLHARVEGTQSDAWEDPSLVQLWGPRFSAYVVAAQDRAVFTLGRLPDGERRRFAEDLAARFRAYAGDRRIPHGEAGRGLGLNPNMLRYAAPTGTILIRWDGARQPTVWSVPSPDVPLEEARLELVRRYLHVFGPGTADGFSNWAGIRTPRGRVIFDGLRASMTPVRTPIGDAWILTSDESSFRTAGVPSAPARLLPGGDTFFLLQGADRELLVPDADRRSRLWTTRVWPGAVLVEGDIVGTWRRAGADMTVEPWVRLGAGQREAVEAEAARLPLPDLTRPIRVQWRNIPDAARRGVSRP